MTIERIEYKCCPLCDGSMLTVHKIVKCDGHPVWNEHIPPIIIWVKCNDCSHVFTKGYFDPKDYDKVLLKVQEMQKVRVHEQERLVMGRTISRIKPPLAGGEHRWLDVGFGSGALMMTAEEAGYEVKGLDLRKDNVEAMQNLGYDAIPTTIESFAKVYTELFSVVSMLDVLEHMPFPKDALKAANTLLPMEGVLVVSMPNSGCQLWRFMDETGVNPYWMEIEHYHNFSRKSLYLILHLHGFDPVEYHVSERYRCCMEVTAIKRREA